MSLYVYCVLPENPFSSPATGLQNEIVRTVEIESLQILVSEFSGSELTPNKQNVLIHERVVESCMEQVTPLPFRFGVVVSEAKLDEFVRVNVATLKADLVKVQGCVEMGLKVMVPAVEPESARTGTEFLNSKRRIQELQQETTSWVDAAVVGLVRQKDVSLMQGTASPIVRIAHLVLRDHLNEYKLRLQDLVRERVDCRFLQSGPWPPYSFISTSRVD